MNPTIGPKTLKLYARIRAVAEPRSTKVQGHVGLFCKHLNPYREQLLQCPLCLEEALD